MKLEINVDMNDRNLEYTQGPTGFLEEPPESTVVINIWYYYRRIKGYLEGSLNLSIKGNYQIFPTDKRGIDFVGYRYFHGYTLLRKRVLLKMKDKIKKLWIKINKGIMMNFRDWCSINSYTGWIIHCNHHRLYNKYIYNLTGYLSKYYYCIICNNKRRTIRYYKNLISKQY